MTSKKVPVTIAYSSHGAQPPIFLAGSFSDWIPEEMAFTTDSTNEHVFEKEVIAEEGGEYQYKFRIGLGDWWVLNESAPTATDDLGNRNNILTVPATSSDSSTSIINTSDVTDNEKRDVSSKDNNQKPHELEMTHKTDEKTTGPIMESLTAQHDTIQPSEPEQRPPTDTIDTMTVPVAKVAPSTPSDPPFNLIPSSHGAGGDDKYGDSSGSEPILTPPTPSPVAEEKATEITAAESSSLHKSQKKHSSTPTPPRAHTPIPEVIVEKVDDKPRHGDDFGEDATREQIEAHEIRRKDAQPDLVVVKPEISIESETAAEVADSAAKLDQSIPKTQLSDITIDRSKPESQIQTPEEVAAEVADVAATLDKPEPEPDSPDEEAGRTGERRMSQTPIPEVAKTASEVADSAALLDHDNFRFDVPKFKYLDPESGSGSGTVTPANERAPLFAHECPVPYDEHDSDSHSAVDEADEPPSYPEEEAVVDPDDPLLEPFPSDRSSILHTVRSCSSRLSADETHFEGVPLSPVLGPSSGQPMAGLEEPSATRLEAQPNPSPQPSPVLDSIAENSHAEEEMAPLPSPTKYPNSKEEANLLEEQPNNLSRGTNAVVGQVYDEAGTPATEHIFQHEHSGEEPPAGTRTEPVILETAPAGPSSPDEVTQARVIPEVATDTEKSPVHGQQESVTETPLSLSDSRPITTPISGNDEPETFVHPANPSASEDTAKVNDFAKSTSFDNDTNSSSTVKKRTAPVLNRSPTPTSLSSPGRDKEARNMFQVIWQTVFVSWIGGLITRICGGRSRP